MTEEKPPAGKTWITIEADTGCVAGEILSALEHAPQALNVLSVENGEDPSDRCNRLLNEAEFKFRDAYHSYPVSTPQLTGQYISEGARLLAEALKVLREEL